MKLPDEQQYLNELDWMSINCTMYNEQIYRVYDRLRDLRPEHSATRMFNLVLTNCCEKFMGNARDLIASAIKNALSFSLLQSQEAPEQEFVPWLPLFSFAKPEDRAGRLSRQGDESDQKSDLDRDLGAFGFLQEVFDERGYLATNDSETDKNRSLSPNSAQRRNRTNSLRSMEEYL